MLREVNQVIQDMLRVIRLREEPTFCSTLDGQCFPEDLKPVYEMLVKQLGQRDALIFVTGLATGFTLAQEGQD